MKRNRPIDKQNGEVCAVWRNSPCDDKSDHPGALVLHITSDGKKILVCQKCKADMENIKNFLTRTSRGLKVSTATIWDDHKAYWAAWNKQGRSAEPARQVAPQEKQEISEQLTLMTGMAADDGRPRVGVKAMAKLLGVNRGLIERALDPNRWSEVGNAGWIRLANALAKIARRSL